MMRGAAFRRRSAGSGREAASPEELLADGEPAIGLRLSGGEALPISRGRVTLPVAELPKGLLAPGTPGSGKTTMALRLSAAYAQADPSALIVMVDGKADEATEERFAGLMAASGRKTRRWPTEPYDGWRGTPAEIINRLLALPDYAVEGPAAYYRDLAELVVSLAVDDPENGTPRSFSHFLHRLDYAQLLAAHGKPALGSLSKEQIGEVALRFRAIGQGIGEGFDGEWAFEDARAAYFSIDTLGLARHATGASRVIFEDFVQFFRRRNAGRRVLFIIDEFSAIAKAGGMPERIEQGRSAGVCFALLPQSVAGMGGEEEAERIMAAVGTVALFRTAEPERFADLAGTQMRPEYSQQTDRDMGSQGRATGRGQVRLQHQPRVPYNEVRQLEDGECFVIRRGRAMKLRVLPPPEVTTANPPETARADPAPLSAAASNVRPEERRGGRGVEDL